jgi:hypothetical protein
MSTCSNVYETAIPRFTAKDEGCSRKARIRQHGAKSEQRLVREETLAISHRQLVLQLKGTAPGCAADLGNTTYKLAPSSE